MQREVNSEPASIPGGSSEGGRTRNWFVNISAIYLIYIHFLVVE
jgi:hypothetical protein